MKLRIKESNYDLGWKEIGTETLYINYDRVRLPMYEKRIGKLVIHVIPEDYDGEILWTAYYTPEIGQVGFKYIDSDFTNSEDAMEYVDNKFIPRLTESKAYNLDSAESKRKEFADRFGRDFTPDDHILVCKDNKKLNIQVGKKYKCTAFNGQRVEVVSIDDILTDDRGDSAMITAYYRGNMYAIASTQLYESVKNTYKNRYWVTDDNYIPLPNQPNEGYTKMQAIQRAQREAEQDAKLFKISMKDAVKEYHIMDADNNICHDLDNAI